MHHFWKYIAACLKESQALSRMSMISSSGSDSAWMPCSLAQWNKGVKLIFTDSVAYFPWGHTALIWIPYHTHPISHLCHWLRCGFTSKASCNTCTVCHHKNQPDTLKVSLGEFRFLVILQPSTFTHHSWNTNNRLTQVPHQCTRSSDQSPSHLGDPPGSITDHQPLSSFHSMAQYRDMPVSVSLLTFLSLRYLPTSRHCLSLRRILCCCIVVLSSPSYISTAINHAACPAAFHPPEERLTCELPPHSYSLKPSQKCDLLFSSLRNCHA